MSNNHKPKSCTDAARHDATTLRDKRLKEEKAKSLAEDQSSRRPVYLSASLSACETVSL